MRRLKNGRGSTSKLSTKLQLFPPVIETWNKKDGIVHQKQDSALWQDITDELCGSNEEEIHANGRLIASAPRMYWLLTEMLKISAMKAQAKTEDNPPLLTTALVAQDGADNIARELLAYIDGTEAQS